jgi:hypothetical protein
VARGELLEGALVGDHDAFFCRNAHVVRRWIWRRGKKDVLQRDRLLLSDNHRVSEEFTCFTNTFTTTFTTPFTFTARQ